MAAEMWYYTTEGKQMDAVTIKELKRLVGDGTLKPTDMVWKEGLPRWIRASSVKELFPDPTSALDQYFTSTQEAEKKEAAAAGKPNPTSSAGSSTAATAAPSSNGTAPAPQPEPKDAKKRRPSEPDDETGRPPRRRPEPKSGGSSLLIVIFLLFGGFVLLSALVVGVIILVVVIPKGGDQPGIVDKDKKDGPVGGVVPINGEEKYELQIPVNEQKSRTFSFRQGIKYDINVSTADFPGVTMHLYVFNKNGNEVAKDTKAGKNTCFLNFTPQEDGDFRIEIQNVAGGRQLKADVTIREAGLQPVVKNDPLPPDVREKEGMYSHQNLLKPNGALLIKFRVRGGHPVTISAKCVNPVPGAKLKIYVFKEGQEKQPGAEIFADVRAVRPDADSVVSFNLPETQIIHVLIRNESKTTHRCNVFYDVSP